MIAPIALISRPVSPSVFPARSSDSSLIQGANPAPRKSLSHGMPLLRHLDSFCQRQFVSAPFVSASVVGRARRDQYARTLSVARLRQFADRSPGRRPRLFKRPCTTPLAKYARRHEWQSLAVLGLSGQEFALEFPAGFARGPRRSTQGQHARPRRQGRETTTRPLPAFCPETSIVIFFIIGERTF